VEESESYRGLLTARRNGSAAFCRSRLARGTKRFENHVGDLWNTRDPELFLARLHPETVTFVESSLGALVADN
jgi:hypothetical protein